MRFGLREKTLVIPAIVLVIIVAVDAALVIPRFRKIYSEALDSRVQVICQNLGLQLERLFQLGLALDEIEGYDQQCRELLAQHPDMSYAAIVDLDGRVLFHSDPAMVGQILPGPQGGKSSWRSVDHGAELHSVRTPIRDVSGENRGYAVVGFPTSLVDRRMSSLIVRVAAVTIVSGMAALAGIWAMLSLLVVRPLSSLMAVIRDINEQGTLEQEVPVRSSDEVGELGAAINALLRGISSRDRQIYQHVNELKEAHGRLEERVGERTAELTRANESLRREIERRREAEQQREAMHNELLEVSRKAGMADIATSVLHNVGNVLNSVNVTATLLKQKLSRHHLGSLTKAVDLLKGHRADLQKYLDDDPQGSQLVPYLDKLSLTMAADQEKLIQDTDNLMTHVDHVKEIVNVQQSLARVTGAVETFDIASAIEDSLKINLAGLTRHGVTVVRQYEPGLIVETDRHKIIQILVNLISNAKYAIHETGHDGVLTITVDHPDDDTLAISVTDTGVGVAPEHMSKLFRHGFTTRKEGHGFGLHASAVAAQQLHGSITVHSDDPNQGATFTLNLPNTPPRREPCPVAATPTHHDY